MKRPIQDSKPPATGMAVKLTLVDAGSEVPADVRLRRLLKALLRCYGFKCEKLEDIDQGEGKRQGG